MICAVSDCAARVSTSAQNSSSDWSSSASTRYCSSVRLAWASWVLICSCRPSISVFSRFSGTSMSSCPIRDSSTASRAWLACSRRARSTSRSAILLRSSSIVSNSDASCANSSSASGNVCDCTLVTVTVDVGLLVLQRAADQGRAELRRLAGGEPGDGLVQPFEHLAGADRVLDAVGGRVLQRLAVLARHQVDGHDVTVGGGALDDLAGAETLLQHPDLIIDQRRPGHRARRRSP